MVPITAIPEREEILAVPQKVKSSKSTNDNDSCGEKKKYIRVNTQISEQCWDYFVLTRISKLWHYYYHLHCA